MNGDITLAAFCHCQRTSKEISPFIIFAVFDVCWFIKKYEIQNGGQPPYWKSSFGYISTSYCPLSDWRDIWYVQVELCSDTRHVTKIAIFKKSRWWTATILKMVSSLYLSHGSSDFNEIWCATADFGSKDGQVPKYQNFANSKWRTAAILQIVSWLYLKIYCPINM